MFSYCWSLPSCLRSHPYLLLMLVQAKDRKYSVAENEYAMSFEDFQARYGNFVSRDNFAFMFQLEDDPNEHLIVFFTEDQSVGVKPIRQ